MKSLISWVAVAQKCLKARVLRVLLTLCTTCQSSLFLEAGIGPGHWRRWAESKRRTSGLYPEIRGVVGKRVSELGLKVEGITQAGHVFNYACITKAGADVHGQIVDAKAQGIEAHSRYCEQVHSGAGGRDRLFGMNFRTSRRFEA